MSIWSRSNAFGERCRGPASRTSSRVAVSNVYSPKQPRMEVGLRRQDATRRRSRPGPDFAFMIWRSIVDPLCMFVTVLAIPLRPVAVRHVVAVVQHRPMLDLMVDLERWCRCSQQRRLLSPVKGKGAELVGCFSGR